MSENFDPAKQHFDAGLQHLNANDIDKATSAFELAYSLSPKRISVLLNLSVCYIKKHDWMLAEKICQETLAIDVNCIEAYLNLSIALSNTGNISSALHYLDMALKINPQYSSAWVNKGNILSEQNELSIARQCFDKAIEFDITLDEAYVGRGNLLNEIGEYQAALDDFNYALIVNPKNSYALWNKSLSLLRLGNFEQGWPLFENRWDALGIKNPTLTYGLPLWLGKESLAGKTILIVAEQGFGDTIQFCRYLPLLERVHSASVVLQVPNPLMRLMKSISSSLRVIGNEPEIIDQLKGACDFICPIMSLPLAFKTTLENVPNHTPYLSVDIKTKNKWFNKVDNFESITPQENSTIKIGLAWRGSGHYAGKTNNKRDIPFSLIIDLLSTLDSKNFTFHGLQIDITEEEKSLISSSNQNIHFYTEDIVDFSDTAGLIESLDLVISIDTAVAHLAGALGKPVLKLIPEPPDFMSLIKIDNSPWYPSTTLVRQKMKGIWPMDEVRKKLLLFKQPPAN
jgi:Tfp pilus assembly protein PilF